MNVRRVLTLAVIALATALFLWSTFKVFDDDHTGDGYWAALLIASHLAMLVSAARLGRMDGGR